MKKRMLALLVCVLVTLSCLSVRLPVVTGSVEQSALPETDGTEQSLFPESQLTWQSYGDYLASQSNSAFEDPATYVDYAVGFTPSWDTIMCCSGFTAQDTTQFFPLYIESARNATPTILADAHLVIADYYLEDSGALWYKVEAAEGYELPQEFVDYPYVLYAYESDDPSYSPPTFYMLPQQATFLPNDEMVAIKSAAEEGAAEIIISVADLPALFDVIPMHVGLSNGQIAWDYYDLGEIVADSPEYRYVSAESVLLIPAEASRAYEVLMTAEDTYVYHAILEAIPDWILALLSEAQKNALNTHVEVLYAQENVEYGVEVEYDGIPLDVQVKGKIPEEGVHLQVSAVTDATVLDEGFPVESADQIITALDIKLINEADNTEWQPESRFPVEVSIDMAALGYEDGRVVRVHHKHEGTVYTKEVFIVIDGKITLVTGGFSIFMVSGVGDTTRETGTQQVNNNGTFSLEVGQDVYYYFTSNNNKGTWNVWDPEGAIHYTVHDNVTNSASIGNSRVTARWIHIVALKKTTQPIQITYYYDNGNEKFNLDINPPVAKAGQKRLYLKDDVNNSGRLVATLVDASGKEIEDGLEGAAFAWTRSDGLFVVPAAYGDNYRSVNIARDHGGLVEARKKYDNNKNVIGYQPTTYTLKVILADGTEHEAKYTVYYQSEFINAGFEFPDSKTKDYSFFPNGYPELYWKTTAPGHTSTSPGSNVTKDIEYGDVTGLTSNTEGGTNYGVWRAADWQDGGTQFAELNAEAVGALYQDIISVPNENIEWDFAHAARPDQSWATDVRNKMYIVIGATEDAQKLTNDQLKALVNAASATVNGNRNNANGNRSKLNGDLIEYNGAQYRVWYHDADDQTNYNVVPTQQQLANGQVGYGWEKIEGTYLVPDNQYRTRIFFVSDPDTSTNGANAGNLIDVSKAGQYKKYLVEYYEETFDDAGNKTVKHWSDYDETGEAIIYSSVILKNFNHFFVDEGDYLHLVNINGENYPYDLRYSGEASLYIEKYEKSSEFEADSKYKQYDIVMQIYFRDTVIAAQKVLHFPTALTDEQELTLLTSLNQKYGGYTSTLELEIQTTVDGKTVFVPVEDNGEKVTDNAVITSRNPDGSYTAFVSVGNNPSADNKTYRIKEAAVTQMPGLELEKVVIDVVRYRYGAAVDDNLEPVEHNTITILATDQDEHHLDGIYSPVFSLEKFDDHTKDIKIADATIENYYKEKMTTIHYKAVGNGKVSLTGQSDYVDTPTEELAFYSGKSKGVQVHTGTGASFVGWFKDEACTDPVEDVDGVVAANGTFKPNANIINADEITFYAKFETCSVTINRTSGEAGKTYVYYVQGPNALQLYVSLTCDASGNGSVSILETTAGEYKITELSDWSWRHGGGETKTQTHATTSSKVVPKLTFNFASAVSRWQWLDGFGLPKKNHYEEGGG